MPCHTDPCLPEFCLSFPQQALVYVSSILLLFFSEPEIQHSNYLWKRALKPACISQQKHMSEKMDRLTIAYASCPSATKLCYGGRVCTSKIISWWTIVFPRAAENTLSFSCVPQRCFREALTQLSSGANQWHSGHSPAFLTKMMKFIMAFTSRDLNNI